MDNYIKHHQACVLHERVGRADGIPPQRTRRQAITNNWGGNSKRKLKMDLDFLDKNLT